MAHQTNSVHPAIKKKKIKAVCDLCCCATCVYYTKIIVNMAHKVSLIFQKIQSLYKGPFNALETILRDNSRDSNSEHEAVAPFKTKQSKPKYLDVLGESLIKLLVVLLVLSQFCKELQALFDDVLADDFQDLALLQHLP